MPGILDDIGAVLADYEASDDAMRWSPERVICDGGKPLEIGPRPPFGLPRLLAVSITVDTAQAQAALRGFTETLNAVARAVVPSLQAFGAAMGKIGAAVAGTPYGHELLYPRSHRSRCRTCNPYGNPRPQLGHYKPGPKAARIRRRPR